VSDRAICGPLASIIRAAIAYLQPANLEACEPTKIIPAPIFYQPSIGTRLPPATQRLPYVKQIDSVPATISTLAAETMLDKRFFEELSPFLQSWLLLYRINPVVTVISTIAMLGVLAAGIYHLDQRNAKKLENNNTYQAQLRQLNETENNIKQLLHFVSTQKESLRETEETLTNLKSEHDKLQPVVALERSTVEAILLAQEERSSTNVWRERVYGIVIGVIGSLIASILWAAGVYFLKKRNAADAAG